MRDPSVLLPVRSALARARRELNLPIPSVRPDDDVELLDDPEEGGYVLTFYFPEGARIERLAIGPARDDIEALLRPVGFSRVRFVAGGDELTIDADSRAFGRSL